MSANLLSTFSADFVLRDGSVPFTMPIEGIDPTTAQGLMTRAASDARYSKLDGTSAYTGVVSGVTPTLAAHLATKGYVDGEGFVKDDGSVPFTATVGGITPTASAHLSTKGYVDAHQQVDGVLAVGVARALTTAEVEDNSFIDVTSNVDIDLPEAVNVLGREITMFGANGFTVSRQGSDTIDGEAALDFTADSYVRLVAVSAGVWRIIGGGAPRYGLRSFSATTTIQDRWILSNTIFLATASGSKIDVNLPDPSTVPAVPIIVASSQNSLFAVQVDSPSGIWMNGEIQGTIELAPGESIMLFNMGAAWTHVGHNHQRPKVQYAATKTLTLSEYLLTNVHEGLLTSAITITLPSSSAMQHEERWFINLRGSTHNMTIQAAAGDDLNGADAGTVVLTPGDSVRVMPYSEGWAHAT